MALDTTREAKIAQKEAQVESMDQKIYELEVERTKKLGNMTSALLLLASSMDALTRFCILSSSFELDLFSRFWSSWVSSHVVCILDTY